MTIGMKRIMTKLSVCFMGFAAVLIFASSVWAADAYDNTFTFSENGIVAESEDDDYLITDSSLTISGNGSYCITGSASEGNIVVDKKCKATLTLSDLSLTSQTTAPLVIGKNAEVKISCNNAVLTDDEPDADQGEGAAIKAKSGSKVTLNGPGSLTLNGNIKNGFKGAAESNLIIGKKSPLELTVTAAANGISCDGSIYICDGNTIQIEAGDDGIKTDPDETDTKSEGTITIDGSNISLKAGDDGIQSAKLLTVNGGTFVLDCADDGLHSNDDLDLIKGDISGKTGGKTVHADFTLTVGDIAYADSQDPAEIPVINIEECYEGLEGTTIILNAGKGFISSTDDCVSAGTDYDALPLAVINGGYWCFVGGDDGIDTNGNFEMHGGHTESYCGKDWAEPLDIDYWVGYTGNADGGMLFALGDRSQFVNLNEGLKAIFDIEDGIAEGTEVVIKDESGAILFSTTTRRKGNKILFAHDAIAKGGKYYLWANGRLLAQTRTTGVWNIERLCGATRYETAEAVADKLKAVTGMDSFKAVALANGTVYPDALSGSCLATDIGMPILLVDPSDDSRTLNYVQENMMIGGTIYLLGGNAAISASLEQKLIDEGYDIKRLAGADRYETNAEILKELTESSDRAFTSVAVVSGNGFADGISASASGMPIIMAGDPLGAYQADLIAQDSIEQV
ncbi:MAG: carbohydrate-binding domain-containing protein, partial [Lachnospiraceae bacterium]|nr:carbohydrate-binding domain-containing protein [Candidatus Equihabitans merdae]